MRSFGVYKNWMAIEEINKKTVSCLLSGRSGVRITSGTPEFNTGELSWFSSFSFMYNMQDQCYWSNESIIIVQPYIEEDG